jgi:hypothetical protein
VAVLKAEVKPEAREAWYEKKLREGVDVFICHPKLVALGLDLIFAPDILFYETGYSIFTLRQASRRSWRIGQRRNVVVKFLHYAGTMQETCLRLMGKKLLVSLAMEGKFAAEGLQAMEDGDDLLMAMARELVTEQHIGETADQVWATLQKEQSDAFKIREEDNNTSNVEVGVTVENVPELICPPSAPAKAAVEQLLMFGASIEEARKRKAMPRHAALAATTDQLPLF